MDKCVEDDCLEYDERRPSNCKLTLNVVRCPAHCLTRETEPVADVPLDRLVMSEMVLIPLGKYMADKADFQMRGAFIKDVTKIVEEDASNWKERLSDWLELLA